MLNVQLRYVIEWYFVCDPIENSIPVCYGVGASMLFILHQTGVHQYKSLQYSC